MLYNRSPSEFFWTKTIWGCAIIQSVITCLEPTFGVVRDSGLLSPRRYTSVLRIVGILGIRTRRDSDSSRSSLSALLFSLRFLRCCWPRERTQVTNDALWIRSTFYIQKSGRCRRRCRLRCHRTIGDSDADSGKDHSICSLFVVASLRPQLLSTIPPFPVRPDPTTTLKPSPLFAFSVVLTHSVNITQTTLGSKSMLPLRNMTNFQENRGL